MRYYDTKTHTETPIESPTTIPETDDKVKNFFKPLPSGKKLWIDPATDLPHVIDNTIQKPVMDNGVVVEGITQAEIDAVANQVRLAEIDQRLSQIDLESLRPLRAINAGTQSQFDIDKLAQLDTEAETLRTERGSLQ